MKLQSPQSPARLALKGYSLVELLVVISCLSLCCGIGVIAVQKTQEVGNTTKLQVDVAAINRSLQIYIANGGRLPKLASPSEVLAHLKTRVVAADAISIVGHSGSFLDPRVTGVSVQKKGVLRAVWNNKILRFVVDTRGEGFSQFVLDDKSGAAPVKTEQRQTVQKFAKRDAWVWDYDGNNSGAVKVIPGDANVAPGTPVVLTPQTAAGPARLQPPRFSVPAGLLDYAKFPMAVLLTNPNPNGSSRILYSLNNGPWSVYSPGSPPALPQNQLNATLQVYAAPINSEQWLDSASAKNLYQTIFFKGSTSGIFEFPEGDSGLITNLPKKSKSGKDDDDGDKLFDWGVPASTQTTSNRLEFNGVSSFFALPDQEFKIGDITYNNGTTWKDTNATSVQMEVTLNLTVPNATERLDFTLKLQSTPNKGKNMDEDADYVWIPTLSSKFSTTVQGQTFYLQLRFGQSNGNSFTTIDEFHVHEGKKATGAIYGKLTTKPVL